jgi:hypothetical protein
MVVVCGYGCKKVVCSGRMLDGEVSRIDIGEKVRRSSLLYSHKGLSVIEHDSEPFRDHDKTFDS